MQHVYYKNTRYEGLPVTIGGNELYSLYNQEGVLVHFVSRNQLDKPSFLNFCLETYLRLSERA
jgi:hypothetical protein